MREGLSPFPPGGLAELPGNVWLIGQESPATQRQDRYLPASVRGHPGKMRTALARRLIETYSRPGDWILDPMSGIGTTGVEAIHLGRHYVGIEIEPRFVAWQRQNMEHARDQGASGRFALYRADARRLDDHFPRPADRATRAVGVRDLPAMVDTVILSPPYANRLTGPCEPASSPFLQYLLRQRHGHPGILAHGYGRGKENVGNLPETAYFTAMRHVYAGCHQVLRPAGLLVIVLQPNRRGPRLLPHHHQTVALCQELGFEFLDEIVAVFGRFAAAPGEPVRLVNHASLWRRLATARLRQSGWPVTLNQFETVLVLRKPRPARPSARPNLLPCSRLFSGRATPEQVVLALRPVSFREAAAFIERHHRHHRPPPGSKFCVGVAVGEHLVGVAIVGRPVARHLDDGWRLEVTRCCTDGTPNACSFLYGTAWRVVRALGYRHLLTYTLASEPGISLKASGWRMTGTTPGGRWHCPRRPRTDRHPTGPKRRWEVSA